MIALAYGWIAVLALLALLGIAHHSDPQSVPPLLRSATAVWIGVGLTAAPYALGWWP